MTETITADEYNALVATKGRSKYGNEKTTVDDITFDSAAEARRYVDLTRMRDAGLIDDLALQVPFPVYINNEKICDYLADFVYYDRETGETVYEDVKGMRTDVYKLKKKMVEAFYRIRITEVSR